MYFFVPDLNGGGAERALVNLLRQWVSTSDFPLDPVLVVRRWQGEYVAEVPEKVRRVVLGSDRSGLGASLATLKRLGKELRSRDADMVVSFLSGPSVFFAARLFNPTTCVVISVQTSPGQWLLNRGGIGLRTIARVLTFVYRHADLLIPISRGIAQELREDYGVSPSRLTVVPNSVDLERVARACGGDCPPELARAGTGSVRIITAGRLVRQKSQEVLIEAVARLNRSGRPSELFILGRGPDQSFLESTAKREGIGDRVHFLGFRDNPWIYFRHADIFALSSSFEGLANVIIEAMACGLPIVSTDAPHGPREILADGQFGVLTPVGDASALAERMQLFIDDADLRQKFAGKSIQRANDFDVRRVAQSYAQVLQARLLSRFRG